MSKRVFESGWEKSQKKKRIEEANNRLPKISAFFTRRTNNDSADIPTVPPASCGDQQPSPNQELLVANDDTGTPFSVNENVVPLAPSASCEEQQPSSNQELSVANTDPEAPFYLNENAETQETVNINPVPSSNMTNDIGLWTDLTVEERAYWIVKGPADLQNSNVNFDASKREYANQNRCCTSSLFKGRKHNGDSYERTYLCYSPTTFKLYCFVCKVFSISGVFSGGWNDWANPKMIASHENSTSHKNALLDLLARSLTNQTIDAQITEQSREQRSYMKQVLLRVTAVVMKVAERGLPLRGHTEKFGSPYNGNVLGLLELLSEFDPFLATHIQRYGNPGSGNVSYMSKTIFEELVKELAKAVRTVINEEIKKSGYFSVSIDSTPDISHMDQLTIIVRYIQEDGFPVERFLGFIEVESHTGESLANQLWDFLSIECGLDMSKLRGQSYDNAANMSGRYRGVQAVIRSRCPYAYFIPCAAHSLNLIGRAAVDLNFECVGFFGIVQQFFNFFSASPKRWSFLQSYFDDDSTVPKSLSDTRWSAHFQSVSSIFKNYLTYCAALNGLIVSKFSNGEEKREAHNILKKMEELEFGFMLLFWHDILERFNMVSKSLQSPATSLQTCSNMYASLVGFLENCTPLFDIYEQKAKELVNTNEYRQRRVVRQRRHFDEINEPTETPLSPSERFKAKTFSPIIDILKQQLEKRGEIYHHFAQHFSFLIDFNDNDVEQNVQKLATLYPADINTEFTAEFEQFQTYMLANHRTQAQLGFQDVYNIIKRERLEIAFPNVETIFKLFLSLMITNCSGERSFSKLKLLKTPTRSTMKEDRLSDLAILSIECEVMRQLPREEIVDNFISKTMRKGQGSIVWNTKENVLSYIFYNIELQVLVMHVFFCI